MPHATRVIVVAAADLFSFGSEFDKADAPSSVKKANPKRPQQQQQLSSRDARALKRGAAAEDYFPSAADLCL
jgi:hypothetical protein